MKFNVIFVVFLIKMYNFTPIIRKHDKPKLRDTVQNYSSVHLNRIKVIKERK